MFQVVHLLQVAVLVPLAAAHPLLVPLVALVHRAAPQASHSVLLLVFRPHPVLQVVVLPQVLKSQNQVWIQPMLLQPTKPLR